MNLKEAIRMTLGAEICDAMMKSGISLPRLHDMAIRARYVNSAEQDEIDVVLRDRARYLDINGFYELEDF